jgi:hypothetical protein
MSKSMDKSRMVFYLRYLYIALSLWAIPSFAEESCILSYLKVDDPASRIWEKEQTFKAIDREAQQKFESELRWLYDLPHVPHREQCYHSCTAYAFATFLDHLQDPATMTPVSANFIMAKKLQIRFAQLLAKGTGRVGDESIGLSCHEITKLDWAHIGVVSDTVYPSSETVNTPKLEKALQVIQSDFYELGGNVAHYHQYSADLIEAFFGVFPPHHLIKKSTIVESILERLSLKKLSFKRIVKKENLKMHVKKSLETSVPVLLAYVNRPGHRDRAGVYHPKPIEDSLGRVSAHYVVITGMAQDSNKNIYYRVQNSHQNAPILYFSEEYVYSQLFYADVLDLGR